MIGWSSELTEMVRRVADRHFIDVASRHDALREIAKHVRQGSTILEIGSASGHMLAAMRERFPQCDVIGSDAIASTIPAVRVFDVTQCPLPSNAVDVVVALNVLEHIENDGLAMQQIQRILKPGGIAVLEVPAGPGLFDVYDKVCMHFRRYSSRSISTLVENAGLKIIRNSHLGFFIYIPFAITKLLNKRHLAESIEAQQRLVSKMSAESDSAALRFLMSMELFFGRFINFPIGIRCLITARKS